MRAAIVRDFQGPEGVVVEDLPDPEVAFGEILIAVEAVSVNITLDHAVSSGRWPFPPPLPHVPGIDPSGSVVAIGEGVEGWAVGDRASFATIRCNSCQACANGRCHECVKTEMLGVARWGGMATLCAGPASAARKLPHEVSAIDGSYATRHGSLALHMIDRRLAMQPGQRLLVTGATGALGAAAVQIGRERGCEIVAATGNKTCAPNLSSLGATQVIGYGEIANIQPSIDGVVETTGDQAVWELALSSLGRNGRLVGSASTGEGRATISLRDLYMRRITIAGATLGAVEDEREAIALAAQGRLRAPVASIFPLSRIHEAWEFAAQGGKIGKVFIEPREQS